EAMTPRRRAAIPRRTAGASSARRIGAALGNVALAALMLLALSWGADVGWAQPSSAGERELVIGTKDAPPFAMKQKDGSWSGVSIELWRRIAEREGLRYRLVEAPDVQALISGVAVGSFDAAVAALTVTERRAQLVDFTQPFYSTGLGVAVPLNENIWV